MLRLLAKYFCFEFLHLVVYCLSHLAEVTEILTLYSKASVQTV